MSEQRPTRVQVTGPRTGRPRRTSISSEIDAQSPVGEIYMHSLMRSQLRLALGVVVMLAVSIGSLPLLFELRPGLRARVGRVAPTPSAPPSC